MPQLKTTVLTLLKALFAARIKGETSENHREKSQTLTLLYFLYKFHSG